MSDCDPDLEPPKGKRARLDDECSIGTHNGNFHCDDALACYMLRKLPEYKDAKIVRTRNQEELDKCDVVVDVGGVFDPSKHRYDHHQKTFDSTMNSLSDGKLPWVTKLSSAGLVYYHFGHRIISIIAECPVESDVTKILYHKIYANFIEEVDAIDNGISTSDGPMRYNISTNVSSRVSYLNPSWNTPKENQNFDELFKEAMKLVGSEFTSRILATKNIWLPARDIVKEAIEGRNKVHESGAILHMETPCPWKAHLLELEKELEVKPQIKFVLFTDQNKKYRVQCVPAESQSFRSRLSLPKEWCGLRDKELSQLSGIDGCIFVHANGFIGGNETYDGALAMAEKTLILAREREEKEKREKEEEEKKEQEKEEVEEAEEGATAAQ